MTTFNVHTGLPPAERLRGTVALWCARHGVSARRFGTEAMGDPCFDVSLARGRSLRLHTADRALAFMGCPPLEPLLRADVEAFLAVSGTKASVLGEQALGNPAFEGRLRRGPRRISKPSTGCAPGWRRTQAKRNSARSARGGRLARAFAQDARALPRERRGAGVSKVRLPGVLPAHGPRKVGLGAAGVHAREERRPQEKEALGRF